VFHTHPKWSTYLTMTGTKYLPVYAQGVLLGDIPLMDSPLSVNTRPMGEQMAAIERVSPIHGDADRRALRVQRSGAEGVPREALDEEPVPEDLGPLLLEDQGSMIPKSGRRFSEKIMLKRRSRSLIRFN
jgi:hypothetical protein